MYVGVRVIVLEVVSEETKILANDYHGKGHTPEEAYTEMLKQTARQLYLCCL